MTRDLPRPPKNRQVHHHTLDSIALDKLRREPRTRDDFNGGLPTSSGGVRSMTRKLKSPVTSSTGQGTHHGRWTTIYYLYGDERRAMRKAIEENESFIASTFSGGTYNPFNKWDDALFQLLCEEWEYYRRHEANDE